MFVTGARASKNTNPDLACELAQERGRMLHSLEESVHRESSVFRPPSSTLLWFSHRRGRHLYEEQH